MVRLSSAALATAALLFTTATAISTTSASGFVSADEALAFAINIPQDDDSSDLYFTMSGTDSSWIAVGMGNDKMAGTLMFMAYANSAGNNVTLSPRLGIDHVEPSYTSNITVQVLPGTSFSNGKLVVNAMCSNCRHWKGGSVDPTNTAGKFIYAMGNGAWTKSNSLSADIRRHSVYGSFTMDLTKAVGSAAIPVPFTADSAGTTQTSDKTDHDFSAAAHACIMTLCFVGLLPMGVAILRILKSPKWHGFNQTFSAALALLGVGLGIYAGTMYNRSKHFNSAHQILGLIVIAAMIAQFVLGFLHHRMYQRTQAPTKLSPIHIWLGRVVIPAGIVNGFLGFPLALNSKYNWALLALVLLVIIALGPLAFWRWRRDNNKAHAVAVGSDEDPGYQSQPWVSGWQSRSDINLTQMSYPPPYQGQPAQQSRQFV